MKLYYLFLLVMFLLMGCTNSSNISGPNTIGTSKVLARNVRQIWKVLSVK